jgi:hypothetical protein
MITHDMLKSWGPCKEALAWARQKFPDGTDLETAISRLVADGHDNWGLWLFNACRSRELFSIVTARGYRNSGNWNSGNRNSGNWNSGYRNSGDWNSGDRNSGNWNSGYRNSGFFNSKEPEMIMVFNSTCRKSVWGAAYKPAFLSFSLTEWKEEKDMTEDEKREHPSCSFTGGFLYTKPYKQAWKDSWESADKEDRERVRQLPNFDAEVFFEITGIDLRESALKEQEKP